MAKLRRFIPVYGGKRSIAHPYPEPAHRQIVEPFAGGAGYSLEYPDRRVLLYDLDERVVGTWDYLIHATEAEILRIPAVVKDTEVDLVEWPQEVRWLVGWWLSRRPSGCGPAKRAYSWDDQHAGRSNVWGEKCRARLAAQVPAIRHWRIFHGSYESIGAPGAWGPSTWFVDPPYQAMGVHYRESAKRINFEALGAWCKSLPGQVIVCENDGADWLPFEPLTTMTGATNRTRIESLWVKR